MNQNKGFDPKTLVKFFLHPRSKILTDLLLGNLSLSESSITVCPENISFQFITKSQNKKLIKAKLATNTKLTNQHSTIFVP
jgi:uncharacterized membrane protein